MPRKKAETSVKTEAPKPRTRKPKEPVAPAPVKEVPKKRKPAEEFKFGGANGKMTREEREAIISEALKTPPKPSLKYTIEETDYTPNRWVVVITPTGNIYREPMPRYWDGNTFVCVMAGIPSKALEGNKIDFSQEINFTAFDVKGVECKIATCQFDGSRRENEYAQMFDIKNSTQKVGGNLVFCGANGGFTEKQAKIVIEKIIKVIDNSEETIK